MQSYNPAVPVSLSQDYWIVAKQVNKKNADKPRVLAINSLVHSLAALAATFSDVTPSMMRSHCQSEFCANLMYHESDPG